MVHADINGDGIQDLITGSDNTAAVTTYVSNGDGSFQAGVDWPISTPNGSTPANLATGDIDRDGKADIVVTNGTNILTIFYGNGNATFTRQDYTMVPGVVATGAVVSDFNRDGKPDLVLNTQSGSDAFQARLIMGTGSRSLGQQSIVYSRLNVRITDIDTGDFDGDAKADLLVSSGQCFRGGGCTTDLARMYGDGLGGFGIFSNTLDGANQITIADLNKDGKSDLVASFQNSVFAPQSGIHVVYGNASRSAFNQLTYTDPPQQGDYRNAPAVADLNGDSKNDIAALGNAVDCSGCSLTTNLYIFDGASGFTSVTKTAVSQGALVIAPLLALDIDPRAGNKRPDLVAAFYDFGEFEVLLNTTSSGTWSTCPDGAAAESIHICDPAPGAIFSSPVRFSVAANSFYPIRKLEIWVNGAKKSETYNVYSREAWVDTNLTLASGTYTATVIAAGYDNRLIKKSVSFSVGGVNTCPAPSTSTQMIICSPANGSTVSSPVSVVAKGGSAVTFMEVWVDGTKRFQTSGNSVNTSLTLAAGSHKMTVFGRNSAGVVGSAVSTFTVH